MYIRYLHNVLCTLNTIFHLHIRLLLLLGRNQAKCKKKGEIDKKHSYIQNTSQIKTNVKLENMYAYG